MTNRVTLTHTTAIPIHNGRNYQELKRERDTRIERKGERKRKNPEESACYTKVSQQTLVLIHCQFKLNRISHTSAQGAEIQHSLVGERERDRMGGVLGERRELEVLLASVKESEEKKKESENSEKS